MATYNSNQLAEGVATPPTKVDACEWNGKLRFYRANYAYGAGGGAINDVLRLFKIPAGKVRIILPMCRIAHTAFAGANADLGWEAYTQPDGTAVAADPNGLDDGQSINAAGNYAPVGTVGGDETYEFDSRDGVVITLTVTDAAPGANDAINAYFVVSHE